MRCAKGTCLLGPDLVDSSAWIELLRATRSPIDRRVTAALAASESLAITGMVMLELLAGARHQRELSDLDRLFDRCRFLAVQEPLDYEAAADLYRACRSSGNTIPRHADCLIAAVAIRTGAAVLHRDADFDSSLDTRRC